MSRVNPTDLDKIIEDSGIGRKAAKKLRKANELKEESPRGHGAPTPPPVTIRDF